MTSHCEHGWITQHSLQHIACKPYRVPQSLYHIARAASREPHSLHRIACHPPPVSYIQLHRCTIYPAPDGLHRTACTTSPDWGGSAGKHRLFR
eukprot:7140285-Pyramimonas_sp.AAC.1